MKFLSPVLRLVLVLVTLELVNVHLVCKKNPFDYQQYLKYVYKIYLMKIGSCTHSFLVCNINPLEKKIKRNSMTFSTLLSFFLSLQSSLYLRQRSLKN